MHAKEKRRVDDEDKSEERRGRKADRKDEKKKKKRERSRDRSRRRHRSESSDSSESSQVFRAASSSATRSGHLRLQRFAEKHPGKLTTAIVNKMYKAVAVEGEARPFGPNLPVISKAYMLRVMKTSYPTMNVRYTTDLRIYSTVLDHILMKRYDEAADVISQQIKATEQALADGGNWERA